MDKNTCNLQLDKNIFNWTKTLAISNGTKPFAIGQKHLQFAIGQKTLVICNVFPPAIEKMFRFKVHEKCLEMSIFVFRLQLRKGLDAKYMKMFRCKVHESV